MARQARELLRLKGIAATKVFVGPRSVTVQITNVCNLSCRFCRFHGDAKKSYIRLRHPREIGFDVFKKLVDDCVRLRVDEMIFSAEGDPLMHSAIGKMARYVRKRKLALRVNSNCATSAPQALKALNLATTVNVNLSATNAHDYAKLQSGEKDVFSRVLRNWATILKARGQKNYPRMNIVFIVNRHNFRDIEKLIDLAYKLKADNVQFQIAKTYWGTKSLAITKDMLKDLIKVLIRVSRMNKTRRLKTNMDDLCKLLSLSRFRQDGRDVPSKGLPSRSYFYDREFEPGFKCFSGWLFARVSLNGEVHYCCHNRQFCVGNIYKNSFKDIWMGRKAMASRLAFRDRFDIKKRLFTECHLCTSADSHRDIARMMSAGLPV
jgi:MoaA/NifB/PqqE/SkfB family radical SAM enzyme